MTELSSEYIFNGSNFYIPSGCEAEVKAFMDQYHDGYSAGLEYATGTISHFVILTVVMLFGSYFLTVILKKHPEWNKEVTIFGRKIWILKSLEDMCFSTAMASSVVTLVIHLLLKLGG